MRQIAQWPRLLGQMLKRDRVWWPVWVVAVALFCSIFVPTVSSIAGTPQEMAVLEEMLKNPAMVAMCGISYGATYSFGVLYTQLMMVWSALLVCVMNILLVIRHTRGDEDEGRLEVIRSLPVGRLTNLAAVAALMVITNLALFLLTGFGMAAFGVESIDLAGSLVYAAALAGCGLLLASVTMVFVQIVHSARAATALSLVVLGFMYLLRAYGDVSSEAVARVSLLGLVQRTLPFDRDLWWPVVVLVGISLGLIVIGLVLNSRRDLGQGLWPSRGGRRAHASRFLVGEWGLAWRLTRGTILAWGATVFVFSAAYGTVMGDMESFVLSSPLYQNVIGIDADSTDIVGPVVTTLTLIMAMIGTVPVLTTAYKLHSEEQKTRMDYVVGKTVSRVRLFVGYAVLTGLVAVFMQVLNALGFWLVSATTMDEPVAASFVFKVAFNYVAAMVGLGGLGLFIVGWAKKLTWIGWAYIVVSFLVVYMGGMLNLPRWIARLTPFGLLQRWPNEPFSWYPWLALVLGGVALAVLGAIGFRRRDLAAN